MKKANLMTGALIMLMTTMAFGTDGGDRFVQLIQNQIYNGTRTGQLTFNEARSLSDQLNQYEAKLWQFSRYGNITRQEERQLVKLEDRLLERLDVLKFNKVTARSVRYQNQRGGNYYGYTSPGTYYGTSTTARRPRPTASTSRPRGTNRGGSYCPPPRRNW